MRTLTRTLLVGAVAALVALTPLAVPPAGAYPDAPGTAAIDGACEGRLLQLHNEARSRAGLSRLREDQSIDQVARSWALQLARTGSLAHNPQFSRQILANVPSWFTMGENVGFARTADEMHGAFMASAGHKGNVLSTRFNRVAVGCARAANGRVWTVVDFVGATTAIADRRPAPFQSAGDASGRLRWWLLARGPSAAQVDADASHILRNGWTAADLAATLTASSSHDALVPGLVRLYGASFDRDPDASGLQYWVRTRQVDGRLDKIAASFVASAEFRKMYGSLTNAAFVDRVYRNVLGRPADASGQTYWVDQLRRGKSRGALMIGFSESPENKDATESHVAVSWAFAQLLGRMPSASERATWTRRLDSGQSEASMVRSLVGSATFATRVASGSY